ncbi:MAG: hypothetical protein C0469_13270 [Cyanobacteria bacterium DS2.3.42]|nr:hypothetical protein [Cyanobacteria bacterium DS2.3.42]
MKRRFLLLSIFLALTCMCVRANELDNPQDEILKKWKSAIISKIRNQVSDAGFRYSKGGWQVCSVCFTVDRNGTISNLQNVHDSNDPFAAKDLFCALVKTQITALNGSSLMKVPEKLPNDMVNFEFEVTSDGRVPIAEEIKNPDLLSSTHPTFWDEWHKKLAKELFERIRKKLDFGFENHPPTHCTINYRIGRNGVVDQLQIEGTENLIFRDIVASEVKSLQNSPLIKFPKRTEDTSFVLKRSEYTFGENNAGRHGIGDFDSTLNRNKPNMTRKQTD